jgi:hypothetical protein
MKMEYWVDPANEYRVVRTISRFDNGQPRMQIDINYDPLKQSATIMDWTITRFEPDGRVRQVKNSLVTEYELNSPISADQFRIEFPAGVHLIDERSGKSSIVLTSGAKREILPAETRAKLTLEQLRDSELGE